MVIELEKTYLAKQIPAGLKECKNKEIIDIYIPKESKHPILRIRKNGDKYEMTKKEPDPHGDASKQTEHTIFLTPLEFQALQNLDGKKLHKVRYYYDHEGRTSEIGVFQGPLYGLILVDFEFDNEEDKEKFQMPDFCLAEVTNAESLAGGILCGKSYRDIESELNKFNYNKLFLK
ncbi:MAG: hypothetical protein Q8Q31_04165 [Nanoarchaeota archaeon]|nr:hypothetical protein [Nanoarchaeota archaeon]